MLPTRTAQHDALETKAKAMFSNVLLTFNDREHGKRIMVQRSPSYALAGWYYFPVQIKSLTGRNVEEQTVMVNPTTHQYRLETPSAPPS